MEKLLIILSCISISSTKYEPEKHDYCKFNCANKLHAACPQPCQRNDCVSMPASYLFRKTILDTHNTLRNELATGQLTRFTWASNMMALSYDMELEFLAYCWAEKRVIDYNTCSRTETFKRVGQNIAVVEENTANSTQLQAVIEREWASSRDNATQKIMSNYIQPPKGVSYDTFAQMMTAKTYKIGCGRCRLRRTFTFINCYYGPAGNVVGEAVYLTGFGATKCPGGLSSNGKYRALCGNDTMPPEANYAFVESGTNLKISNHLIFMCLAFIYYLFPS